MQRTPPLLQRISANGLVEVGLAVLWMVMSLLIAVVDAIDPVALAAGSWLFVGVLLQTRLPRLGTLVNITCLATLHFWINPGDTNVFFHLILLASIMLMAHRRRYWEAGALTAAGLALLAYDQWQLTVDGGSSPVLFILFALLLVFGWFAGWGLGELERQSARRVAAEYAERQMALALDIHDFVSHRLTSVLMDMRLATPQRRADPEFLTDMEERLTGANTALRGLAVELHGGGTAEAPSFDPVKVLDQGMAELAQSGFACSIRPEVRDELHRLGHEEGRVLGRLLHEALHNVAQHGDPRRPVALGADEAGERLVVEVVNAARPQATPATLGLGVIGMHQRAHLVGGSCTSREEDGQWVCRIDLPLGKDARR